MVNNKYEYLKMSRVEESHWWYKSLHDLVKNILSKNFNNKGIRIIDAGCGTGGLLHFLSLEKYTNIYGFDISKDAIEIALSKNLNVRQSDLKDYKDNVKSDVIISNDTIYFFSEKEQEDILNSFYNNLNKNGIVILNLPSFESFNGIHDQAVGIRKRFNRKMIENILNEKKFEIIQYIYWPFLLSPIIFIVRLLQRIQLKLNKNILIKSDIDIPYTLINNILYRITTIENKFIKYKPFGSSLFLVLKKI